MRDADSRRCSIMSGPSQANLTEYSLLGWSWTFQGHQIVLQTRKFVWGGVGGGRFKASKHLCASLFVCSADWPLNCDRGCLSSRADSFCLFLYFLKNVLLLVPLQSKRMTYNKMNRRADWS